MRLSSAGHPTFGIMVSIEGLQNHASTAKGQTQKALSFFARKAEEATATGSPQHSLLTEVDNQKGDITPYVETKQAGELAYPKDKAKRGRLQKLINQHFNR